jgi:hypothetical protein
MQKEQKNKNINHDESLVDNVIMAVTKEGQKVDVILLNNMNAETAMILVITLIETAQKLSENLKEKGAKHYGRPNH